jgi:hypothetical protein
MKTRRKGEGEKGRRGDAETRGNSIVKTGRREDVKMG